MQKHDVNDLPELLRSKKITMEEARASLWTELYFNPFKYDMNQLDEDQKSDFLILIQEKFNTIFETYNSEMMKFSSFVSICIKNYLLSWKRKKFSKFIENQCLQNYLQNAVESEQTGYEEDFAMKISDPCSTSEVSELKKKSKKSILLGTIMLALKACTEIDDQIIENISSYTGFSKDLIYRKIEELKNGMVLTERKRNALIKRRNNAFYFHRKYKMEMESAGQTSFSYNNLKERYEHQTKSWIKNNLLLQQRYRNSPSNSEVARVMGLKPRMVSFYIKHAKNYHTNHQVEETSEEEQAKEEFSPEAVQ